MIKLGDEINTLERTLRELIKLWERYFAGDLRVPPVSERSDLERRLRRLSDRSGVIRSVDSFRLEQLQHRFMTYAQNWERMLREREEGRGRSIAALRAQKYATSPEPANVSPPTSVHTAESDGLFERYRRAKEGIGQRAGLDRDAFERQIAAQRASLEAKLGREVRFDVKVDNGKVKLVVRKSQRPGSEE